MAQNRTLMPMESCWMDGGCICVHNASATDTVGAVGCDS
eukprot:CAMPEP_0176309892 /NCGR_PEP_ID=MMETSP0121_2-20121125/65314_1 /TAXON_ID=160619 /ORGANISM="Kryptoperidinium foliaceum, Strain CCMP 1326" /LENGTH=38 /DNA_ID= /DNA_START= /DNA_END= /DNA_ORIENTATION=